MPVVNPVVECYLLDHPQKKRIFKLIYLHLLDDDTTFNDLCAGAQRSHDAGCDCKRVVTCAFIATPDWVKRWLASAEGPDLGGVMPAVMNGDAVIQVENSPGTDIFRHILFSVTEDIPPGCMPLRLVNDRVFVPNVASNRVRLPSPSDDTFGALLDGPCIFIDKTPFIEGFSTTRGVIQVIIRPSGYGRSTFLRMMADIHDLRPRGDTAIPPSLLSLPLPKLRFQRYGSMVLLLDLKVLDMNDLANSLKRLLHESVLAFAEKYHPELQYDVDSLRSCTGVHALALIGAAVYEAEYDLFLGIDNYSAPYECSPESEWGQITDVMNQGLYTGILNLLTHRRLPYAIFTGSLETIATASLQALKGTFGFPSVRNAADVSIFNAMSLAFTGIVYKSVEDVSFDLPSYQEMLGMTKEDICAVGNITLKDDEGGLRLWHDVEKTVMATRYMSNAWHKVPTQMYSFTGVLERLRHLLGHPNDDLIFLDSVSPPAVEALPSS